MKLRQFFIIIYIIILSSCSRKLISQPSNALKGMIQIDAIEGYIFCSDDYFNRGDAPRKKVSIDNFWMKETEVTVGEYFEFIDWVKTNNNLSSNISTDSIIFTFSMPNPNGEYKEYNIPIYPDTSIFIKDFYSRGRIGSFVYYFNSETYRDYPVVGITWYQAQAYVHWLTETKGEKKYIFQLPTEAQWECAARGTLGEKAVFPWDNYKGDDYLIIPKANYRKHGYQEGGAAGVYTMVTGREVFPPNSLGLKDMAGNVAEWCEDAYHPNAYNLTSDGNPCYRDENINYKVIRGGSFNDPWVFVQCGMRWLAHKDSSHSYIGFRYVASVPGHH